MPIAGTSSGGLHYEVVDHVAPWRRERPTILFHHGIGASADIWNGWLPALIESYRIVTWDMRGYGRSVIPPADFKWSLDLLADDVFAVADAVGVEKFHLVGESIGGTAALAATLARPGRVTSLAISNGAHLGASIQRVEAWKRELKAGSSKNWSDNFMQGRFHENALSTERWNWFAAQQEKWTRDSILNALGVLIGTDLSPKLKDLTAPVLILHPDGSPFIPVPIVAEMHGLLPNARLHVFNHARHGLPFSHGRDCSEILRSFLDTLPAG